MIDGPFRALIQWLNARLTELERTVSSGGVGSSLTVQEVDGSPSGTATTLVLPNGTLGIVGSVATYTPTAGGGDVTHTAGALTLHAPVIGNGGADIKTVAVMSDGQLLVGATAADPVPKTVSGDAALAASGALTLASTAVTPGSYTSVDLTVDAKGRITAAASGNSNAEPANHTLLGGI